MTGYLTFNKNNPDAADLEQLEPKTNLSWKNILPLNDKWQLWEQVVASQKVVEYASNTKPIATFDTVQSFWTTFYDLPQPSQLLCEKRLVTEGGENAKKYPIDALMIFKGEILPMWEHPVNASGGHFECRFKPSECRGSMIDQYWNNLVLGLVGDTVEDGSAITGIRLVDKLSVKNQHIRIEIWFRKITQNAIEVLKNELGICMAKKLDNTIGVVPTLEVKFHV